MDPTPSDAELRTQQNAWIKQRFRQWQAAWHDAFDDDPVLRDDGEYDRPDDIPDDIDTDYRLLFGLWRVAPDTLRKCFSLFPAGGEMRRRFTHFLADDTRLTEAQARELACELARRIEAADPDPNESADWTTIRVVDRHGPQTLSGCGRIADLFEHNHLTAFSNDALPTVAAYLFLTEPLYASAGNYYELRDWVTGALFDPRRDMVHTLAYRLWHGGWQPLYSAQGLVLAYGHKT